MARKQVRRFVRPAPSTKIWVGVDIEQQSVPANSAVLISGVSAGIDALRPFTILRSHLQVHWQSDQAAVTEDPFGAVGVLVTTEQAVAAGVASLPDPITEPDADWFVFQPLTNQFLFLSSVGFDGNSGTQFTIDSKAMRRVGLNQQFPFICANANAGDGAVITIIGRQLLQLH